MQIKVDQHIQELLYENNAVNIPGLGGLVTQYQPAQIDHLQAKILPPAREVTLNTNLTIDDGLLTQKIAETHGLSGLEAEGVIREYVDELLAAIDAGNIVSIEEVGRIYRNHSGDLYLMSDHTNFDTAAYGLPAVASPVIRRQEVENPATPPVTATVAAAPQSGPWETVADWFQRHLWLVVSAAMVIFITTVWLLFFNDSIGDPGSGLSEVKDLPEDRVNVKPSEVEDDELVMEEPVDPGAAETPMNDAGAAEGSPGAAAGDDEPEIDTESPTLAPAQSVALIRIGLFGDRNNVQKLVQRIYDEGFEPYTREKGSLIEVGVQFAYDDREEVRTNLRTIQRKFEEKAKVVE